MIALRSLDRRCSDAYDAFAAASCSIGDDCATCALAVVDAEQPGDLAAVSSCPRRTSSPRALRTSLIRSKRLAPCLRVGGKHRRNGGQRSLLIDQQHVELLAHERLELRQRHVAMRPGECGATSLEAALVDRGPRHAGIEQRRGRRLRAARRAECAT